MAELVGPRQIGRPVDGRFTTWQAVASVAAYAGSVTQLAVPSLLAVYFGFVRRESYATALMLAWLGASAHDVASYIADAPHQALPLLGNGLHDWVYILATAGRLDWAQPLSRVVWAAGLLAVFTGLVVAVVRSGVSPRGTAPPAEVDTRRDAEKAARLAALPRREPRNRTAPRASGV